MSPPVPSGLPTEPSRRVRGPGRWLAAIGLVLLVVAGAMIGAGIARFDAGGFTDLVKDPASALDERIPSPGARTVRLTSGRYWVFAIGDRLIPAGSGTEIGSDNLDAIAFKRPRLTVRGPTGGIEVRQPGPDVTVGGTSNDMVLIYEFRVPRDGRYAIRSSGGSALVSEVGVGDTDKLWDSAKHILGPAALIIAGALLGLIGGSLLLVAAILWITGRSGKDTSSSQGFDGTTPFG